MYIALLTLSLLCATQELHAEVSDTDLNEVSDKLNGVKINKCCEHNEIVVDGICRLAERYNQSLWTPQFKTEDGNNTKVKYFNYVYGVPDCATTKQRAIFDLGKSEDTLNLLSDGRLRHIINHQPSADVKEEPVISTFSLHDSISIPEETEPSLFIHNQTKYCMDKVLVTQTKKGANITGDYALVCVPDVSLTTPPNYVSQLGKRRREDELDVLKEDMINISDTDLNEVSDKLNGVKINKCCEHNEIVVDGICRLAERYNQSLWTPQFKTEDGNNTKVKYFNYVYGVPDCATTKQRAIFDLGKSEDTLNLLSDGRLRHIINHQPSADVKEEPVISTFSLHDSISIPEETEPSLFIHNQTKYCMDKVLVTQTKKGANITGDYALVCVPDVSLTTPPNYVSQRGKRRREDELDVLKEDMINISDTDLNEVSDKLNGVKINKCCEHNEIVVDGICRLAERYNQSLWTPQFKTEDGNNTKVKYFNYVYGVPDCATTKQRAIFDLGKSEDTLNLLSDGRLRHIINHQPSADVKEEPVISTFSLHDSISIPEETEPSLFIHNQTKYCMDKVLVTQTKKGANITGDYALVCVPDVSLTTPPNYVSQRGKRRREDELDVLKEDMINISDTDLNEVSDKLNGVKINKCCEHNEIVVDGICRLAERYNQSLWTPQFKTEDGNNTKVKYFNYVYGVPDCATTKQRAIFDLGKSEDTLNLLSDGRLRHIINHQPSADVKEEPVISTFSLHDSISIPEETEPSLFIHNQTKYCMDKVLVTQTKKGANITGDYALVCVPDVSLTTPPNYVSQRGKRRREDELDVLKEDMINISDTDLNEVSDKLNGVKINKCCEHNEIVVDGICRLAERYNQSLWTPQFKTEDGNNTKVKYFNYVYGVPDCATTKQRAIFDLGKSEDTLNLLSDGRLRHIINHQPSADVKEEPVISTFSLHDSISIPEETEPSLFIHNQTKYCMDKVLVTQTKKGANITGDYALVCVPDVLE